MPDLQCLCTFTSLLPFAASATSCTKAMMHLTREMSTRATLAIMFLQAQRAPSQHASGSFVSGGKKVYQCLICAKRVLTACGLRLHERLHSGSYVYSCPYSGKGFSGHSNLKGHLVHHTGIFEFKCNLCLREFRIMEDLKNHIVKDHTDVKTQ